jgi:hypothetical protein
MIQCMIVLVGFVSTIPFSVTAEPMLSESTDNMCCSMSVFSISAGLVECELVGSLMCSVSSSRKDFSVSLLLVLSW